MPRRGKAGSHVSLCLIFSGLSTLSCTVAAPLWLYSHQQHTKVPLLHTCTDITCSVSLPWQASDQWGPYNFWSLQTNLVQGRQILQNALEAWASSYPLQSHPQSFHLGPIFFSALLLPCKETGPALQSIIFHPLRTLLTLHIKESFDEVHYDFITRIVSDCVLSTHH